ncbi:hypothetical protein OUZ56_029510 [Daphnia magna]|uniref:Uncharacterized protein n=1 Tax=Daphnia magna TaxID=35525 RepID=A0ABR0B712_9CRUS|nr:hypothetical protein OUZ56_029510 [Daphnia magna]
MTLSEIFWNLGHKITCHNLRGSISMGYRLFRSFFGTSPQVYAIVWDILSTQRPPNSTPNHLLWGFLLLKQYNIESVNAVLVGASEKTFRKWSSIYVRLIANLPVLDWEKVSKTHLKAPLRLSLLMALIVKFWSPLNSTQNCFRINSADLAFAMKLDFASQRGILFGPTADTHAANGPT